VVRPQGAESQQRPSTAEEDARIEAIRDSLAALRPARLDSVYNGADDDGSGSVAMLEIAQAFVETTPKPKRSILFVWHTAEEKGLFGARYFTDNPTVPRDSIVASINIDMIGRGSVGDIEGGGPGYLQIIGSRRLSTELGDLVETVNAERGFALEFDYQFDADGHPDNYYCRSDHYMYARYGIPIVFFSTGSHQDYHMLTDEAQYIDYDKMARVSQFVFELAGTIANLDHRPLVDKPKPDPNAPCRQ
jgi:Zn-dependent M28 family amino/carboxypeptidase